MNEEGFAALAGSPTAPDLAGQTEGDVAIGKDGQSDWTWSAGRWTQDPTSRSVGALWRLRAAVTISSPDGARVAVAWADEYRRGIWPTGRGVAPAVGLPDADAALGAADAVLRQFLRHAAARAEDRKSLERLWWDMRRRVDRRGFDDARDAELEVLGFSDSDGLPLSLQVAIETTASALRATKARDLALAERHAVVLRQRVESVMADVPPFLRE